MTRRPPSIITEFIVMIIAIGLVAGGLEAYLRVTATHQSKLYEGIETVPEIADTYFQHVFLEKHATKDAWNNANYDPQLGWDYQIAASRIRGPRKTGPKPAGMFRVIALGDSFTWGIEAGEDEHFPHYLEKILQGKRAAEVFNMGVGSYGIDQMLLKYERHGQALRPDVVVLGIFPHDYDRTRLSFYSYSKPIFRRDEKTGQYALENVPVPPPKEVYASLKNALNGNGSHAWVFVKNRVRKLLSTLPGSNGYYEETDRLVEHLLARLQGRSGQDRHEAPRRSHPAGKRLRERRSALARQKRTPDRPSQGPVRKIEDPLCRSARGASGETQVGRDLQGATTSTGPTAPSATSLPRATPRWRRSSRRR